MDGLVLRSRGYSEGLRNASLAVEGAVWSEFGFLNATHAHRTFYDSVIADYPEYQLCLVDQQTGEPVALANSLPARFEGDDEDLPEEGWDWLLECGAERGKRDPNVLGALAISVPVEHRSKGYASRMLKELRDLAGRRGLRGLIAPVRPTAKCDHPEVSMDEYITWRDRSGRVFDPWLRCHLRQGGKLVRPCERSMVVNEHIAFWETWAGRRFDASGTYVIQGALAPLAIDIERQMGLYEEPNVWVSYTM